MRNGANGHTSTSRDCPIVIRELQALKKRTEINVKKINMPVVCCMKMVSFNGRSIRNKLASIMTYLKDEDVDLAFVQETWIRKSDGHLSTEICEYEYDIIL